MRIGTQHTEETPRTRVSCPNTTAFNTPSHTANVVIQRQRQLLLLRGIKLTAEQFLPRLWRPHRWRPDMSALRHVELLRAQILCKLWTGVGRQRTICASHFRPGCLLSSTAIQDCLHGHPCPRRGANFPWVLAGSIRCDSSPCR